MHYQLRNHINQKLSNVLYIKFFLQYKNEINEEIPLAISFLLLKLFLKVREIFFYKLLFSNLMLLLGHSV